MKIYFAIAVCSLLSLHAAAQTPVERIGEIAVCQYKMETAEFIASTILENEQNSSDTWTVSTVSRLETAVARLRSQIKSADKSMFEIGHAADLNIRDMGMHIFDAREPISYDVDNYMSGVDLYKLADVVNAFDHFDQSAQNCAGELPVQ